MLGQNSAPAIFSVNTYHQLHLVRLQRLPAESRREGVVPVELAAGRCRADFTGPGHDARRSRRREFATLAEYSKATGQDRHSVLVDYDVFVNVRRLDAQDASERAEALQGRGLRFPAEARIGRRRSRRRAAERDRRLRRPRAGSRRARSRASPCRTTGREIRSG